MYDENRYCKVFISGLESREEVGRRVVGCLEPAIPGPANTITSGIMRISVRKNDDYDKQLQDRPSDGFLWYPFFLDVLPTNTAPQEEYVLQIATLLRCLWDNGIKAVAACDFEEDLPAGGGKIRY